MSSRILPERGSAYCAGSASLLLLAACASAGASRGPAYDVTVAAGAYERRGTPVSFQLPEGLALGATLTLHADGGNPLPAQLGPDGRVTFILDHLPARESRRYRLTGGPAGGDGVRAGRDAGGVAFSVEGGPVLRYNAGKTPVPPSVDPVYTRGGYLHPVHTPSGKVITADYAKGHLHHHGIWAAWTNTVFEGRTPDFWNMAERKGTVEPVALDMAWGGPVHGGFRARHRYVDLTGPAPEDVLNEVWSVMVYDVPGGTRPYRLFDLEIVQTTASSSPLHLPLYRYGGLGFRGRDEWLGAENTFFLTSEGKDRSNGHESRARWAHVGGMVDGALAGIGILGHPANFRFPEPMRIHPTEPFFNWAPSQAGDWSIQPGTPHVARYRFVTYDGGPDAADLDRLWNDYAHPPTVTLEPRQEAARTAVAVGGPRLLLERR